MDTEEDESVSVLRQPVTYVSKQYKENSSSTSTSQLSSAIRKRFIQDDAATAATSADTTTDSIKNDYSSPSDSARVWNEGEYPYVGIPTIFNDVESSAKPNGVHCNRIRSLDNESKGLSEINGDGERTKVNVIRAALSKPFFTFGELRSLACSGEGFVNDDIRRILWPALLGLREEDLAPVDGLDTVHKRISNDVYQQILKDVVRSASHFPAQSTEEEIVVFENEMTQMICWVLERHKRLNYYQGYNDVAATVLMVMGLERGIYVLENISLRFLERFMEATMEKVNQELFFIFALLERVHPTLLQHLENVELFPHFALAEYTTWYAHKYSEHRKLLHRLFDYFLGSPTLMPLYLSTVIVAHRATEIFNTTPDMGHTHKVLCTLPEDLPFENLLIEAKNLYRKYPPESIENDVRDYDTKRRRKEQEWKRMADNNRKERERRSRLQVAVPHRRGLPYRVGSYRTIAVVTVLAIGIYAFLKTSTGLD